MSQSLFRRSTSASLVPSIALPPYSEIDTATTTGAPANDIELQSISSRSVSSLPTYADITDEGFIETPSFVPTQKLQIETLGKALFGLPLPPRPDPIPVYDVTENPDILDTIPLYVSLRYSRSSGNCSLVRGDDDMIENTPLCSTTYRTGPGRNPKIALFPASRPGYQRPPLSPGSSSSSSSSPQKPDQQSPLEGRDFDFTSKSFMHRTQVLQTHLGTFEWRYAPSKERKVVGADSLLLLERVVKVALVGGKSEERRTIVAQFVRNSETRTTGSRKTTAGNGGRLLLDLREWADTKGELEEMRLLTVASCISMLKKEVDRRRMQQAITISAMAGGGAG